MEAQRFSHDYIGTEHILRALLDERFSSIRTYLDTCHVLVAQVVAKIDATSTPGVRESPSLLPFTPRAKGVLDLSEKEADICGSETIDVTHLFVALLSKSEEPWGQILSEFGLSAENAREALL